MAKATTKPQFEQLEDKRVKLSQVDDRANVELLEGDEFSSGKKKLRVHSSKWNNRAWLEVLPAGVALKQKAWKLNAAKDRLEIECEGKKGKNNRGEVHRLETGSLKWSIIYGAASDLPETPYAAFSVSNPPGLTFHYQPALTQAEIDEGCVRPDDVVGSYAVYWPESGRFLRPDGSERVNYETGRYCHIYRPKWIDDNGAWTWGEQTITDGELRIALPAAWLASATWPVTLDPTFGYTSIGASTHNAGQNYQFGFGPYSGESGSATSVSVYCGGAVTSVTMGLYADSSGNPGARLSDTAAGSTAVAVDWVALSLDTQQTTSSGTSYWIAKNNDTTNVTHYFDAVAGFKLVRYSVAYNGGVLTDPFGFSSELTTRKYSAYATYTEAASGQPARKRFGGVRFASPNYGVW